MKKFVGYAILGANSEKEAQEQLGLQVWMTKKPNWFKRLMLKKMLNIFWVDRVKELEHYGIKEKPQHHTSFNKYSLPKSERRRNEYKGRNSEQSDRS